MIAGRVEATTLIYLQVSGAMSFRTQESNPLPWDAGGRVSRKSVAIKERGKIYWSYSLGTATEYEEQSKDQTKSGAKVTAGLRSSAEAATRTK